MLAVLLYSLAKLSLRAWTDTVRACVVLAAATAVAQSVDHHLAYAVGAEQPHAVDDRLPKVVGGWLAVAARVQGFLDSGNGRLIRHPLIVNLEFRRRTPKAFPLKVGCINA